MLLVDCSTSELFHPTEMQKEVEQMIDRFLEYVMENHQVNKERASILQALQISVVSTYFTMYCFNLICHALE